MDPDERISRIVYSCSACLATFKRPAYSSECLARRRVCTHFPDGKATPIACKPGSFVTIRRRWTDDKVVLELPKGLWADPIPDEPGTVAFLDGPAVLAGLVDEQRTLYGDKSRPETILAPDNEREWGNWLGGYRTINQNRNFRLLPIHEVVDQKYTVYFPVRRPLPTRAGLARAQRSP